MTEILSATAAKNFIGGEWSELVSNRRVRALSFTNSVAVGHAVKSSGRGPHEQGRAAMELYTETATVYQDAPLA